MLSSKALLLALWGVDVCLAAAGRGSRKATLDVSSSGDRCIPLSLERMSLNAPGKYYDDGDARKLALSVLERCEHGPEAISECLMLSVRSNSLKPRFNEIRKLLREWKAELLEGSGFSVSGLNSHCKASYDVCVNNFKDALDQFGSRMKSADFFPSFSDPERRMRGRSTDLSSLKKAIVWDKDEATGRKNRYNALASEIRNAALEIKALLSENMGKSSERWRHLIKERSKFLDVARGSREGLNESFLDLEALIKEKSEVLKGDGRALEDVNKRLCEHRLRIDVLMQDHKTLLGLVGGNIMEINRLAQCYLAENEGERWESFVRNVGFALNFKPLADVEETHFFDGFERFVTYFMVHVKERYGTSSEAMLSKDTGCSKFLSEEMRLIWLENDLGCEGVSISGFSESDNRVFSN